MKKYSFWLMGAALALLITACSKSGGDVDPKPDPDPDPDPGTSNMILPKKQMRAVWMATVWGLDWPNGDYNAATQKQQYIAYLEKFKELNMNAVFVQIKGMGDAFYNSPYEPWSGNITGTRGTDPGYDVLKFMIDEAHARGLEFHAWMNPFRIATRAGSTTPYPQLHSSVEPGWVVSHEKWQMYNPAIPEARQRLAAIVKDIITKYDVDGIHMDDYFYPDPSSAGIMVADANDYQTYGAGYATIEEFRRANVDKAIKGVYDIIVATKPQVIFSISPTSDFNYNRNTLYADIRKWANEGWMDVVIPQIYHNNTFSSRLTEWDQFNNKPHLMVGHGYYMMTSTAELTTQFNLTKNRKAVVGNLLYSAKYLNENPALTSQLAAIFKDPAVIPFLGRAVAADPAAPQNVRIESNQLKWTASERSVVYYTPDLKQEAKVLSVTTADSYSAAAAGFYAVTSLNADNKESAVSKPVRK